MYFALFQDYFSYKLTPAFKFDVKHLIFKEVSIENCTFLKLSRLIAKKHKLYLCQDWLRHTFSIDNKIIYDIMTAQFSCFATFTQ